MLSPVRKSLDILLTMGGLGMGAVISVLSSICLLLVQMLLLDPVTLAIAWSVLAFIFCVGFISARRQMNVALEEMEAATE